ncbi:TerB family tellurite resistance protein [Methylobacterium organophilum]|uniref:tellurite resistance TerB family protein n=1 Tax=Methylobacterium organophilum TaxID=410 RepID=UPI001F141809|nr:TerB family tellurite resistance protein [Methylobacterium organophilum]UMY19164.1 TerB family tellurite resistance protein [Methylobacterium organophilum]
MALVDRLIAYAAAAFGRPAAPDIAPEEEAPIAVVALLVHVARADGVLAAEEMERLVRLVRTHYAVSEAEARSLIARAGTFEAETRDLAGLVEGIGATDEAERARLVAMAWSVAGADGAVHEFEEALVCRLGTLFGLDEARVAKARAAAVSAIPPSA